MIMMLRANMGPSTTGACTRLCRVTLLALSLLACTAAHANGAEHSVRWSSAAGGPKTTEEVFTALGEDLPKKREKLRVTYYTVNQPDSLPEGYRAVVRERLVDKGEGPKPEAMYKVRGPEGSAASARAMWKCPLRTAPGGDLKSKEEFDVSWTGAEGSRRVFSMSCTVKGASVDQALPSGEGAKRLACGSDVERAARGKLTVERWALPGGGIVFDVSRNGDTSAEDARRFVDKVLRPLLARGATPLVQGMTELGSFC